MPEKLLEEDWKPDYGERKIHPTAGVTAVGVRMPLVAFNINLDTDDLEIANNISKIIRGSSGGYKYCKAIGVMLEDRNIAQVSINMVNLEKFPLYRVVKPFVSKHNVTGFASLEQNSLVWLLLRL